MAMNILIGMPLVSASSALIVFSAIFYFIRRRRYAEVMEDWELEHNSHRYKYKDLYIATNGFNDSEIIGRWPRGSTVYQGVLPNSNLDVAIKKVKHKSRLEMKAFVAEIVSISRIRHPNIVRLLGYCRRKGELLLVYDYMPNRSLDKFLYDNPHATLHWWQRFRVIKEIAAALLYLHEGWEQVVIHRDVKASNVLLDSEWSGKLGDFGVVRLYDENNGNGKATTKNDVYDFGLFMLEVASGKRAIGRIPEEEDEILVDWVNCLWTRGEILTAKDPMLGRDYNAKQMELVLKLGVMCSVSEAEERPSMRQVVQYLDGDIQLPKRSTNGVMTFPSSVDEPSSSSVTDTLLSEDR